MNVKAVEYIENSFLKDLLKIDDVTDISFNGVNIFYLQTYKGRQKSNIVVSVNEVLDFLRQIANLTEKQFSFATPFLDISVGRYRINAVHSSIVRVNNEKSCSFSIRIASKDCKVIDDYYFLNKDCRAFLKRALIEGESIAIGGSTGSGKTELQKYLLLEMCENSRVILIDNVEELEFVRTNQEVDLTSWQVSKTNTNASIQELVRNALRSNPDWLVIAEARGKEMNEILNSTMTGHPVITTLHTESLEDMPERICRMVEMSDTTEKHENILADVYKHIKIYIYITREITATGVKRFVKSIGRFDSNGHVNYIFRR